MYIFTCFLFILSMDDESDYLPFDVEFLIDKRKIHILNSQRLKTVVGT